MCFLVRCRTSSICTLFRCPSFSWWCRDPGPCARWVCVVRSFGLVGGHPPCGPHGFWFTPFVHFCTRDPERHWSALHTCQPSDPMFKSYRIRFVGIAGYSIPTEKSTYRRSDTRAARRSETWEDHAHSIVLQTSLSGITAVIENRPHPRAPLVPH